MCLRRHPISLLFIVKVIMDIKNNKTLCSLRCSHMYMFLNENSAGLFWKWFRLIGGLYHPVPLFIYPHILSFFDSVGFWIFFEENLPRSILLNLWPYFLSILFSGRTLCTSQCSKSADIPTAWHNKADKTKVPLSLNKKSYTGFIYGWILSPLDAFQNVPEILIFW